jgi:hypothetical protein
MMPESELIVACVRTGSLYGMEYVTKLRNMVSRHLMRPHVMVCLTDQPERCEGVVFVDVTDLGLLGWFAKMVLFSLEWRGLSKVVYIDLDTVIINSLLPLTAVAGEFAICQNFARLAGVTNYPCKYNSSIMVIGGGQAGFIWTNFDKRRTLLLSRHVRHGDQAIIEDLYPTAPFLQDMLPKGFFCNYRNLTGHPPKGASIVNFGGSHKPHNCPIQWVQEAWQ